MANIALSEHEYMGQVQRTAVQKAKGPSHLANKSSVLGGG